MLNTLKHRLLRYWLTTGMCAALVICWGCNSQSEKEVSLAPNLPKSRVEAKVVGDEKGKSANPSNEGSKEVSAGSPPNDKPQKTVETEKVYTEAQLHKNDTLHLLASPPDIRARKLLLFLRQDLTSDQMESAVRKIMEQDQIFQDMIKRRAKIQNDAVYGDDTGDKLRRLKIEIYEHSQQIRSTIMQEYLSAEQAAARKLRLQQESDVPDIQ